MGEEGYIKINE